MLYSQRVIAHRGASGYAPENTMASFEKALAMGATCVEFDVMLSEDGQPFVIHDTSLRRTTNGKGDVGLSSAAYISSLDAGTWFSEEYSGETVPRFQDLLLWLAQHPTMQANIEIKPYPGQLEQTTDIILSAIKQYWPSTKALPLVSSFEYEALERCISVAPAIPRGFLMHYWDKDWLAKATAIQAYSIHCNHRLLSMARVSAMHEAGHMVLAYTVNKKSIGEKLFAMGVDAVFTNYPDYF
ncbi:MAG: glycerophosphoryl diester phosphodiesterase [Legionellaceae bacterium]|nr:glycerophosphoryl diester phosphodiesterase [Legionellaceae bacterium]